MIKIPSKLQLKLNLKLKLKIETKFNKLEYVRYADDWGIGVRGSKQDCVDIIYSGKS